MKITINLATCTRDDLRALLTLTPVQDAFRALLTQAAIDGNLDVLGDTILRVSRNLKNVPPPGKHDPATPDRAEDMANAFHAAMERGLSPWLARLAAEIECECDFQNYSQGFVKVTACRILRNLSTDWAFQDWAAASEYFGEPASQLRAYGHRHLGLSYCVQLVKTMFPQFDC